MDPIPCPCCDTFFVPRNKLQIFCSRPGCQRARKNLWQKHKLATDPEYKKDQHPGSTKMAFQQSWLLEKLSPGKSRKSLQKQVFTEDQKP